MQSDETRSIEELLKRYRDHKREQPKLTANMPEPVRQRLIAEVRRQFPKRSAFGWLNLFWTQSKWAWGGLAGASLAAAVSLVIYFQPAAPISNKHTQPGGDRLTPPLPLERSATKPTAASPQPGDAPVLQQMDKALRRAPKELSGGFGGGGTMRGGQSGLSIDSDNYALPGNESGSPQPVGIVAGPAAPSAKTEFFYDARDALAEKTTQTAKKSPALLSETLAVKGQELKDLSSNFSRGMSESQTAVYRVISSTQIQGPGATVLRGPFRLEQNGGEVRLIDVDGSVYQGKLNENSVLLKRESLQRGLGIQGAEAANTLSLRAAGTNLLLNKSMEIQAALYYEIPDISQKLQNSANNAASATAASNQSSFSNRANLQQMLPNRIEGRAQIGTNLRLPFSAVLATNSIGPIQK